MTNQWLGLVLWDSFAAPARPCRGIFMEPTDALEKAGLRQGLLDFSPQGARGAQLWQRWSELDPIVVLLDWFQGTFQLKP